MSAVVEITGVLGVVPSNVKILKPFVANPKIPTLSKYIPVEVSFKNEKVGSEAEPSAP